MNDFESIRRCYAAGRRSVTALVRCFVDMPRLREMIKGNAGRIPEQDWKVKWSLSGRMDDCDEAKAVVLTYELLL